MLHLLIPGFLSLWMGTSDVQTLNAVDWSSWLDASWIASLDAPELAIDPSAEAIVLQHLARVGSPAQQNGVWIQSGHQIVAEHQGITPLSAASLTKIATTLAALETWGVNHQFETLVSAAGSVQSGVLQGDLIVQGGGDPFFVWEEAIALGNALNQAGINRVTGNLIITGDFAMNYEADPIAAGELLRDGLNANRWNAEAAAQYAALPAGTARPAVVIDGTIETSAPTLLPASATVVVRHRSLPLTQILKAMNIYSNNFIADGLANTLGGGNAVATIAATVANVPMAEVQLINGSGLGDANRLSPRAVAAMLMAIQNYLQPHQINVADLFPVIGRDRGTLGGRTIPTGSAVKTGTLNAVSSLAGVIPTRDRGLVWFTIINLGTADLQFLHNQQDALLQGLTQQWGTVTAIPAELQSDGQPDSYRRQLGDASRNQIVQ